MYHLTRYNADDVSTIRQQWTLPTREGAEFRYQGHVAARHWVDLRDETGYVLACNMPAAEAVRQARKRA